MTGSRMLSGGKRRRRRQRRPWPRSRPPARRRRRRRIPLGAIAATGAVCVGVLLFVMAGGVAGPTGPSGRSGPSGPSGRTRPGRGAPARRPAGGGHGAPASGSAGHVPAAALIGPPVPSGYGVSPAPPSEHVVIRLLKPLRSGLLFNVATGQVLWQRRPDAVLPIASLTKMMTALIVATLDPPRARVLITRQAVDFQGSGVGLLPLHKRVPIEPLLYGLLLPSGNDAAIALAQHTAGTQPRFITFMNARARAMGLGCTHYTTVSGIVDAGNHSCAADLAKLARAVLDERRLARIVASASATLRFPIKGGKLYVYNNNPLYRLGYPGTDGLKTGYTTAAGVCLVATARRGHTWLGVVLLHSADEDDQAPALLNAGFAAMRRR